MIPDKYDPLHPFRLSGQGGQKLTGWRNTQQICRAHISHSVNNGHWYGRFRLHGRFGSPD